MRSGVRRFRGDGEGQGLAAGSPAWLGAALLAQAVLIQPALAQGVAADCREACVPTASGATVPAADSLAGLPVASAPKPEESLAGQAPAPSPPASTPPAVPSAAAPPPHGLPVAKEEEILVSAPRRVRYDPLEGVNIVSFEVVQAVDKAVVGPLAHGYESLVPEPARDGIHNMVHNLREPYIALNFLLQHRVGKSLETLVRLLINSTVGLAGIFDVARRKPINLPRRPNGFADTMGFYGVKPGPYLFLPLVGPSTVRDLIGNGLDRLIIPLAVGNVFSNPVYGAPLVVFGAMDRRLKNEGRVRRSREAVDAYSTLREEYLMRRRIEIEGLHYHRPAKDAAKVEVPKEDAPKP